MKNVLFTLAVVIIAAGNVFAQDALKPKPSPLGMATFKQDDAYIKITYSQPHLRDREAFGNAKLIPYGKVWRTGANEATEITTTKDIMLGGKKLSAGTYSIFTIPNEDEWTVIINSELGQWGAYNYNEESDVIRFTVPVAKNDVKYEPFTIKFDQADDKVSLNMMWDDVMVSIPVSL